MGAALPVGASGSVRRTPRITLALGGAAVLAALLHAYSLRWLCDDAFISFRYARNLVDGQGLVFNPGEWVEGYTNPLWTVFVALGLRLGVSAERWSMFWGIVAFGVSVAVLFRTHLVLRSRLGLSGVTVPVAALGAALHPEWATFATSGLESSIFCLFLVGTLSVLVGEIDERRAGLAGLFIGLATVTRHDGVVMLPIAATALVLVDGGAWRRRARLVAALAIGFSVVFVPVTYARIRAYGSFFPNTYWAKSGNLSWWSQGAFYLWTWVVKYWGAPIAVVVAGIAAARLQATRRRTELAILGPALAIGSAFGVVYALWVAKVGGDFMYGRLLVPTAAPLLVAFDAALLGLLGDHPAIVGAIALLSSVGQFVTPSPVLAHRPLHGIGDERAYYDPAYVRWLEDQARTVTPFLQGLPVRVAIYGSQARLAYRAPIAVAIEAHTGLTDAFIAKQPLAERTYPGHEKHAPHEYIVMTRKAHLTFSDYPTTALALDAYIPRVTVRFGGVVARVLHWDPDMVAALRARGARVDDYPRMLDELITKLPTLDDATLRRELDRARHFYFAHCHDPEREAPFLRRLSR